MRKIVLFSVAGVLGIQILRAETAAPLIEAIQIRGNASVAEKEIRDVLPFQPGDAYHPKQDEAANELVLSIYRSQGFMHCAARTRAEVRGSSATVTITIDEGPLFVFGDTRVEGLDTLPLRVVTANLSYRKGEAFQRRQLFETQSRLYRSGFFSET